jgi:hypothetical protein
MNGMITARLRRLKYLDHVVQLRGQDDAYAANFFDLAGRSYLLALNPEIDHQNMIFNSLAECSSMSRTFECGLLFSSQPLPPLGFLRPECSSIPCAI